MPSSRLTKNQIRLSKAIMELIDAHIPAHYVDEVQARLQKQGLQVKQARIHNVRNGRTHDLAVLDKLERISELPEEVILKIAELRHTYN